MPFIALVCGMLNPNVDCFAANEVWLIDIVYLYRFLTIFIVATHV